MTSGDRHQAVEAARLRADLSVQQLWLRYLAMGGSGDAFEVDGYLQGLVPLEALEEDVLAQTVNEALGELYRSLEVPLSVTPAPDGAIDAVLADVVDQLLAHPRGGPGHPTPHPAAAPPRDEISPRPGRPGTQPET